MGNYFFLLAGGEVDELRFKGERHVPGCPAWDKCDSSDFSELALLVINFRNCLSDPCSPPQRASLFKAFQASSIKFNPFQALMAGHIGAGKGGVAIPSESGFEEQRDGQVAGIAAHSVSG